MLQEVVYTVSRELVRKFASSTLAGVVPGLVPVYSVYDYFTHESAHVATHAIEIFKPGGDASFLTGHSTTSILYKVWRFFTWPFRASLSWIPIVGHFVH